MLKSDNDIDGIALSPGSVSYETTDKTSIAITLSVINVEMVKTNLDLATSITNTYLRITPGAISDTAIESNPFNDTTVLRVIQLNFDTTSPSLILFNFDLDVGELTLSFNDIVNGGQLDYTELTFQNTLNSPNSNIPTYFWPITNRCIRCFAVQYICKGFKRNQSTK